MAAWLGIIIVYVVYGHTFRISVKTESNCEEDTRKQSAYWSRTTSFLPALSEAMIVLGLILNCDLFYVQAPRAPTRIRNHAYPPEVHVYTTMSCQDLSYIVTRRSGVRMGTNEETKTLLNDRSRKKGVPLMRSR